MTYADAEAFLLDLPRFAEQGADALKPGLERMETLLATMDRPHERFPSIHVAGTNGKGSTASLIAAIGTASGLRVGLHTSPHLLTLRERMRLDGMPVPEAWVADAVGRYRDLLAATEPSFFEATVALSFLYFAEERVDLAVVEVGLGGRLDATNVLTPRLALITHIARDHADLLGDTLEAIAREKAGIAKPGVSLLSAARGDAVRAAIHTEAERRGARPLQLQDDVTFAVRQSDVDGLVLDLRTPVRRYDGLHVGLAGHHQATNAALAVRAAELAIPEADEASIREGLQNVRKHSGIAGRWEVIQRAPLIVADVAHNADGLAAALAALRGAARGRRFVAFGVMQDKEPAALAALLAEADVTVLPIAIPSPRALPPHELDRVLREHGVNARAPMGVNKAIEEFLRQADPEDALLVTGSHLTVAPVQEALKRESSTLPSASP